MKLLISGVLLVLLGHGALAELSCYSCSSEVLSNCATLIMPLVPKVCDDPQETQCVTTVFGGHTVRGCKSEVDALISKECDAESCAICEENSCNGKMYPEDRLKCHQCQNCDYIENDGLLFLCPNYDAEDTCYTAVKEVPNEAEATVDIVSYRGCSSSTSSQDQGVDFCLANPATCLMCGETGCNKQATYSESTLKCYKCDSTTNSGCAYAQTGLESETCEYNVILGASEACYTYEGEDGSVTRGCLKELAATSPIRKDCEEGDTKCQWCTASECNAGSKVPDYGQCVTCDGTEDPNCALLEDSYTVAVCGPSDVTGCFRSELAGVVARGCVSDLIPQEVALCQLSGECKICEGDLCNVKADFAKCHQCDSRTNPNCVAYQTSDIKVCQDYMDSCAGYIDLASGATIRGCKKEMTEYKGCEQGDNLCVECDRNFCNAASFPAGRPSCFQCEGEACKTVSMQDIKICSNYQESDSCYSVYSEVDGVGHYYRGCMSDSDSDPGKALCLANDADCNKCTTSDCNSGRLGERCYTCDGTLDSNCASLTGTAFKDCEGDRTGCFHSVIDGFTVRGCAAELSLGEVSRCEDGQTCKLCQGDKCNSKLKYQSCVSCDSNSDPNCRNDQENTVSKVTCAAYDDHCVSYNALGVTYRGCAKEFNLPEDCLSCKFCSGDDCNTEPIEDYGECYVCDDSNDENKSCAYMINVDKVSCGPSEKKGCFRSEIDGVVVRGCASQLQPEGIAECEKGDVCKFCEGDGCNKKTDFQSCYSCDTTTDAYCSITQLVGSPKKVCADYMDTCVVFKEGEHTYRGCAKELPVPEECPGCKYCEWRDCNYEATEYFGQCRYCDGTPACAAGTDPTYISCPKGDHPQDTCFRSEIDGVVVRGCANQLSPGEANLCTTGSVCKFCVGPQCNAKKDFQTCLSCNSLTDPNCVNEQTSTVSSTTCQDYLDECVTHIDANGATYRGCAKPANLLESCSTDGTCSHCKDADCNSAVYPPNRLQCQRCDSDSEECLKGTGESSVCPSYVNGDACYTTFSADKTQTYRGCMSSNEVGSMLCSNGVGSTCDRCTQTGCNSKPFWSPASISCVKCAANDEACEWGYDKAAATACEKNVWMGETESCYTVETSEGGVRGCLLDDPAPCDSAPEKCAKCSETGCNTKSINKFSCYQCKSDVSGQESCAKKVEGLEASECPSDEIKLEDLGCYLWKNDDNTVERGCLNALDDTKKAECTNAEKMDVCEFCAGESCNDQDAGAAALTALSTLALVLIAGLISWY